MFWMWSTVDKIRIRSSAVAGLGVGLLFYKEWSAEGSLRSRQLRVGLKTTWVEATLVSEGSAFQEEGTVSAEAWARHKLEMGSSATSWSKTNPEPKARRAGRGLAALLCLVLPEWTMGLACLIELEVNSLSLAELASSRKWKRQTR